MINRGPRIKNISNDTEAISYINNISGNNYTNIDDALLWTSSQDDIYVHNKYVENVVTDGLVLYLDASNLGSYPGTGNVWYDMSGNENNCNFNNTPTYNSDGYFTFNGSSNYGTITNNSSLNFSSEMTLTMMLNHDYTSGRKNPWDQAYGGYGTITHENGSYLNMYFGDSGANAAPYVARRSNTTNINIWNYLSFMRDTSYTQWFQNGIYNSQTSHSYGTLTTTSNNIRIGCGYAGYWDGDMSIIFAYNRKLSNDEIEQNYNELKNRFI
jgi:hypothetical protein